MSRIVEFVKRNKTDIRDMFGCFTICGASYGFLFTLFTGHDEYKPFTILTKGTVKGALIGATFPISIPLIVIRGILRERRGL